MRSAPGRACRDLKALAPEWKVSPLPARLAGRAARPRPWARGRPVAHAQSCVELDQADAKVGLRGSVRRFVVATACGQPCEARSTSTHAFAPPRVALSARRAPPAKSPQREVEEVARLRIHVAREVHQGHVFDHALDMNSQPSCPGRCFRFPPSSTTPRSGGCFGRRAVVLEPVCPGSCPSECSKSSARAACQAEHVRVELAP